MLDTGFTDELAARTQLLGGWDLEDRGVRSSILADGRKIESRIHRTRILWLGQERVVYVRDLGHRPLLGFKLLHATRITLHPDEVILERLESALPTT